MPASSRDLLVLPQFWKSPHVLARTHPGKSKGGHCGPQNKSASGRYWTFSATSSITNDVCRLLSSCPRKRTFTVCPLNCDMLNECCWYPVAWFRFENVPSVATTVPAELST